MAAAREGLARSQRLLNAVAFARVMRSGCQSRDKAFTVYAMQNVLPQARLGMVVSRRTSHKAVVRNRIKRRIRESFRHKQTLLAGLDVVVVARQPSAEAGGQDCRKSLERHWAKIVQLCKRS